MNINLILSILGVLLVVALFVSFVGSRPRGAQFTPLANVGEGFQPPSQTFLTDAAFAERYLLVKGGSDALHVALCGVGDIPKGIAHDSAAAAEESVTVHKFGLHREGAQGVASGAIAVEALLVPGANGTVRTLPAAAGTYYIIGRATKAAADTDRVEFTPCFPIQRVVP
jgi:hypothetical protein